MSTGYDSNGYPRGRGERAPARHCWVVESATATTPGLLLEWRRTPQGWEGLCVFQSRRFVGRWATVTEWLPAELISPARGAAGPTATPT